MEQPDSDQFDDLLDGALKHYGEVEPRVGLDARVLARLVAEVHTTEVNPWKWPSATAAFACILVIFFCIGIEDRRGSPQHIPTQAKGFAKETHLETAIPQRTREVRSTGKYVARKSSKQVAEAIPRLGRFPSPRPLSEQEEFLIAYVSKYPKQAAEVAQEQSKRDKELQALYPVPGPDSNQER